MNGELTTISISERRVVKSVMLKQEDGTEREMAKILLPDSGTILRPAEQIRKAKEEGRVIFSLPKDFEVNVSYRKEGVPEDAPKDEKYTYKKMSTQELKDLINPKRDKERDENMVSITVERKRLYDTVEVNGKSYIRIGTPDNRTFLRPTEQVRESKYDKTLAYFSLPKTMPAEKDREEGPYQITLSKPILDENGGPTGKYDEKQVTSEELKKLYDDYYEKQRESEFAIISFPSSQVVGSYTHKSTGEEMAWIAGPEGYRFTRPADQIHESPYKEGMSYVSLPKEIEKDGRKENYTVFMYRTERVEGVPDTAPPDEKFRTVKSEMSAMRVKKIFDNGMVKTDERQADNLAHIHIRPENIISQDPETKKAMIKLPTPQGVNVVFEVHQNKLKQEKGGYGLVFNADTKVKVAMEMKKENGSLGTTKADEWTAKDLEEAVSGKTAQPEQTKEKEEEKSEAPPKRQGKKARSGAKR